MINEPQQSISEQMVAQGLLETVDTNTIDDFVAGDGLRLLFFTGPASVRRESHDVAVALRELLGLYGPALGAGVVTDTTGDALAARFRVQATPCLVFLADGETLELLPRVRDWADYAAAFRRYLGDAPTTLKSGAA